MPRDIEIALKNLQYVSMTDFCNRIDRIKNIDDKLAFATEYLLCHKPNIDYALDEAINVARMKLADAIAEYKEMKDKAALKDAAKKAFPEDNIKRVNLKEYGNVENNEKLNYFMAFPETYLKLAGTKKLNDLENEDVILPFESEKQECYERTIDTINNYDLYTNLLENDRNYLHIGARLEAKFGGIDRLHDAANATKPTFFAKLFRRTSNEGKDLLNAYKGFSDQNSPLFGRKDTLERAADAYLKHIYPNWEHGYPLVDQHHIDQLSGTQKARVILCNAILEATRKEDKMLTEYNNAINNDGEKNIEFNNLFENQEIKKENIIDLDKDLDDDLSSEKDNDMESLSDEYVLDKEAKI